MKMLYINWSIAGQFKITNYDQFFCVFFFFQYKIGNYEAEELQTLILMHQTDLKNWKVNSSIFFKNFNNANIQLC